MDDLQHWPAWFYGSGGAAEIFARAEDVPPGWRDTPAEQPPEAQVDDAPKRGPGRPRKVTGDGNGA